MKRVSLRLPDELHEQVEADAKRNRRSLNAEILWRLEQPQDTQKPA